MHLILLASAFAATDHLGGTDTYNNQGDMLKLVVLEAEESSVITNILFSVYNGGNTGDVELVLYHRVGKNYELVGSAAGTGLPDSREGTADSGDVAWLVEAGETYAVGAWIEGDWYYYYSENGSDDPWFGSVTGSVRYDARSVPDSFSADLESYFYDMTVTSVPADGDADGFVAAELGGDDCDDADATVNPGGVETPYDGVDQDCSGADLVDVDGDGADAEAVGGHDCDDEDATVLPSATDDSCDGVDQDCSGADACGNGDSGGGVDASPDGCGCQSSPGAVSGVVLGVAAGLLGRRRRS